VIKFGPEGIGWAWAAKETEQTKKKSIDASSRFLLETCMVRNSVKKDVVAAKMFFGFF